MGSFQIFTDEQISSLRKGGSILRGCLTMLEEKVQPGMTTAEVDALAEEFILSHEGARPGFKGYHGFPATLCTSVNDECVHGIPGDRVLEEGDIVSTDCGVILDELYTDACVTIPVGEVTSEAQEFLEMSKEALKRGVAEVKEGARVGDISSAIQKYVESQGCKCMQSLTGHGLGDTLHQFPDIPNFGKAGTGPVLPINTLIAIEPITSMGTDSIKTSSDGWTICTRDGSLSGHFEHSVLVTEKGFEIIA